MIWKKTLTLAQLNQLSENNSLQHLGIEFIAQGDDWLAARMPVDKRSVQPMGYLNGGLSVALAESVASMAAYCTLDENHIAVGIEINASHLRSVRDGFVVARAQAIKLGKQLQVWEIEIIDQASQLCCNARLTLSILERRT